MIRGRNLFWTAGFKWKKVKEFEIIYDTMYLSLLPVNATWYGNEAGAISCGFDKVCSVLVKYHSVSHSHCLKILLYTK